MRYRHFKGGIYDVICEATLESRPIQTVHTQAIMHQEKPQNPLHGVTLENILTALVDHYGWEQLGQLIDIRCFQSDPSIKSSLTFLRKTPWAREKVEALYIKLKA